MDSLQQLRDERLIEQHHLIHKRMQRYLQALEQRYQRQLLALEATKNETKRYIKRWSYKLGQELVQIQDQMDHKRLLSLQCNYPTNVKTEYSNTKINHNINNGNFRHNQRVNSATLAGISFNNNRYKNMSRLRSSAIPMTTTCGNMNHSRYLNIQNSCNKHNHINGNGMTNPSNSSNVNRISNSANYVSKQNHRANGNVSSTCKRVVVRRKRSLSKTSNSNSKNDGKSIRNSHTNSTRRQEETSLQYSTNQNNNNYNINNGELDVSLVLSAKTEGAANDDQITTQNNRICHKSKHVLNNISTTAKIEGIKDDASNNNTNNTANKDGNKNSGNCVSPVVLIKSRRRTSMDYGEYETYHDNESDIEPDCDSVVNDSTSDGSIHESDNSQYQPNVNSNSSKPLTATKPTRRKHTKFNSRKTDYPCPNCKKYYSDSSSLRTHLKKKICMRSDDSQLKHSDNCDTNDSDGINIENTMLNSQSNGNLKQKHNHSQSKSKSKSRMSTSSKYYTTTIDMNSIPDGKYPCRFPGCGARFKSKVSLGHHQKDAHHQVMGNNINKMNDADLPFPCGMCNKRFGDNRHLIKHIQSKHTTVNKSKSSMFKCDKCHRGFDKQLSLSVHLFHSQKNGKCRPEEKQKKKKTTTHKKRAKSMGNLRQL